MFDFHVGFYVRKCLSAAAAVWVAWPSQAMLPLAMSPWTISVIVLNKLIKKEKN